MSARRVLVATGLYPPDIGGPATHTVLMEQYLPGEDMEVAVVPFGSVRHLPVGIRHGVYFLKLFFRALRSDIVFAQDTVSVGIPARCAALITRSRFVVRVPGDHVWEQARQRFGHTEELDDFPHMPEEPYLQLMRGLQFFVVRSAHVVIVPSDYLKRIVSAWAPKARIEVVHNGIAFEEEDIREPEHLPPEAYAVTVARLVPWKGVDTLIEAAARLKRYLVIVGDGPQRGLLEAHAASLGMEGRVRFVGRVPHGDMLGWVKNAKVFVLNSSYEGMAHTLVEASALGVPIVATDIAGNREVLDETNAILVPVGDTDALAVALKDIFANEEDARLRALRAREHAKEFTIDRTMGRLAALLHTL